MAKKPRFRGNPTRSEENVSNTNPPTNEVMMNAPVSSGTLEVPRPKADSKKARMQKTAAAGNGFGGAPTNFTPSADSVPVTNTKIG